MKNILNLIFVLVFATISAQVTNEGKPLSWKHDLNQNLIAIKMPSFNLKALQDEDAINDVKNDRPWRFGHSFDVNYDMSNSGTWSALSNGDKIWRIRIKSEGAKTLNFLLKDVFLPEGSFIYLYNHDKTAVLGAYDAKENNAEKTLATWLIDGDDVWIEYFEPAQVNTPGTLKVAQVTHGYRSQKQFAANKGLNDSGNCNHDVNCPIGELEELKNHMKKGIVILLTGGSSFCSGSLINNTANNNIPYVLTANHCYSNPANWSFRFNWISPNPVCASTQNSTNGPTTQTISGATLRARRAQSDFCLVQINNPIPATWDVVWNGWDKSDNIPTKTFGIHHPSGDIMKVCVDNDPPGKLTQNGNTEPVWRIYDWDLGVTEGGSSGSALFDSQGRIVGQLWRGSAACSGTNDNGGWDEYGRFGRSWNDGTTAATRLKDWLDPTNSNVDILNPFPAFQVHAYDVSIAIDNVPNNLCVGTISPVIKITNLGTENLTSATINYQIQGQTPTSINWNGNLTTGQFQNINVNNLAVSASGVFEASVTNPNGQPDGNLNNNNSTKAFELASIFETTQVQMTIIPDNFGSETSWNFKNSAGVTLYSGGPYTNNNTTPINVTFNIPNNDCYTYTILDSYGDGICCQYGTGSYQLQTTGGQVIVSGAQFGGSESTTFSNYNFLSVSNTQVEQSLVFYPNPTKGILNIFNKNTNNMSFDIISLTGQKLMTKNITSDQLTIDISHLSKGVYIVKSTDMVTGSSKTQKIILE